MTQLVVVGLSHHTAPLALRERLLFDGDDLAGALGGLAALPHVEEAVLLSTCNRTEVYAAAADEHAATLAIRRWLGEARGIDEEALETHLYEHVGRDAVRHLSRVASSLDSMVVGEPQITGQVKDAYGAAAAAGTVGALLHRCMHHAFAVAKRARTETSIGKRPASIPSVAVDLARRVFGDLAGRAWLLVGAGEMSELAARHVRDAGGRLLVVSRSFEHAVELARRLDARPRAWDELEDCLLGVDIVLTATGSREPVLGADVVACAVRARRYRPLVFIDIAAPRDVDPRVGDLENVYLFDLDALDKTLAYNLAERARHARDAEQLVEAETDRFVEWLRGQAVVPTIKDLRATFTRVARAEEERLLRDLPDLGDPERRKIRLMLDALVGRLLHAPLTALRGDASDGAGDLADAARRLFDLEAGERAEGAAPAEEPAKHRPSASGDPPPR